MCRYVMNWRVDGWMDLGGKRTYESVCFFFFLVWSGLGFYDSFT
jgi:hypothetical protein